jgi:hypothetical protein
LHIAYGILSDEQYGLEDKQFSRRQFVKLMGAGTMFLGLGALGISDLLKNIKEASATTGAAPPNNITNTWSSTITWNNGKKRFVPEFGRDPYDPLLHIKGLVGSPNFMDGYFIIDGKGTAEFKSMWLRFFVHDDLPEDKQKTHWGPNVEVKADIKIVSTLDNAVKWISVGACSNHFGHVARDNQRANGRHMAVKFYVNKDRTQFMKEHVHGVYLNKDISRFKFPLNKWVSVIFTQRAINDGKHMKYEAYNKVEGSNSYTKLGETIDDGNWSVPKEGGINYERTINAINSDQKAVLDYPIKSVNQVWNLPAFSGIYMRMNEITEGYLREVSVREIAP